MKEKQNEVKQNDNRHKALKDVLEDAEEDKQQYQNMQMRSCKAEDAEKLLLNYNVERMSYEDLIKVFK